MPKVNSEVLIIVQRALEQYTEEVEDSGLQRLSKNTYLLHAQNFVRWLDDDFEPGANVKT